MLSRKPGGELIWLGMPARNQATESLGFNFMAAAAGTKGSSSANRITRDMLTRLQVGTLTVANWPYLFTFRVCLRSEISL
jgi:hypothetical protein